jgi:hypothetical protein
MLRERSTLIHVIDTVENIRKVMLGRVVDEVIFAFIITTNPVFVWMVMKEYFKKKWK